MKATEKQKEYMREYYQRTKDEKKLSLREYYQENKGRISIVGKVHYQEHKEEKKARTSTYYRENREGILCSLQSPAKIEIARKWRAKLKEIVLTYYGNGKLACVKCGFSDIRALSIDHIKGDGAQHRREIGNKCGKGIYGWLRRNGYPESYQTLCMNCQFVKKAMEMKR